MKLRRFRDAVANAAPETVTIGECPGLLPDLSIRSSLDVPPNILKQHKEVHRVCWGWNEVEMLVKAPGFVVICLHGECAYASYIRRQQGALHRVSQQRLANALALPVRIDCRPGKQHDG